MDTLVERLLALGYTQGQRVERGLPPEGTRVGMPGGFALDPSVHGDLRGRVFEAWRASWERHEPTQDTSGCIEQVYCSVTYPDVVKGWHCHAVQTDRFLCVRGRVVVALCDLRDLDRIQTIQEVCLDSALPRLLVIPPGVAHGWYCPGPEEAHIINLVSHEYGGTDEWRRPADAGPYPGSVYTWRKRRDG